MTDNLPIDAASDEANNSAPPFSVGNALREARMSQNLSVDEISNRIKFAPRQIEALESDDFTHLPEIAFVRGFVRSYARLLQLDDVALLAALPHSPEQSLSMEAKALTEVPYPDIYTERKHNIIWLSAALAVAILLGLAAWLLGDKPKEINSQISAVSGTQGVMVEQIAAVSGAQNVMVETLALPAALPISAVPDKEPITVTSGAEKASAEKASAEKASAEKASAEKASAEKASAEKASAEKASAEKASAEKASAEKASAEKASAEKKKVTDVKNVSPPAQPTPVPAKQAVKPATANNVSGQAVIRITFDADSWVSITDKDGKHLLSQLNHAGTEQSINGSPPFSLTIGYAKAVHLYYKGKAVDLEPYADNEVAHLTLE